VLGQVTPLIITFNEAHNIRRALAKLDWAKQIVVVDSGSTDETVAMLQANPRVVIVEHPFTDFAGQCNFGLTQIASPWVLSLDADYELSDELVQELDGLSPPEDVAGYNARFVYRIYGRCLRGSLYPPRVILYRRERARYRQQGHAHRVVVDGAVTPLRSVVYHDDRKPLERWIASQRIYARAEADHLLGPMALSFADRVRRMGWPAPIAVFFYVLLIKGCLFDGWPGWYYTMQRCIAEALLALEIGDRRLRDRA
jgi:glycosyltransferase involved in cell wall biosynthesis